MLLLFKRNANKTNILYSGIINCPIKIHSIDFNRGLIFISGHQNLIY